MLSLCRLQPRKIHLRSPDGRHHIPDQESPLRRLRTLRQTIPAQIHRQRNRPTPPLPRQPLPRRNQPLCNRSRTLRRKHHQRHRNGSYQDQHKRHHHRQPHLPLQLIRQRRRCRTLHDEPHEPKKEIRLVAPDHSPHPQTLTHEPHHPERPRRIQETLQLLRQRIRHRPKRQRQTPPLRQTSQSPSRSLQIRLLQRHSL